MKRFLLFLFLGITTVGYAQSITDGVMMPKKAVCTGFMYAHDQWTEYWEGTLKRDNENIGTVTTTAIMWGATYGVTDKINAVIMIPYVKTSASGGTLSGMEGIQDLTLAVKYNIFNQTIGSGTAKTFGVLSYSRPLTDYTPDFLPLSIGLASQNLSYRATAHYALTMGVYVNVTGAYTWRSNVTLDRPSYYTDGQIYYTDEVKMPNVFDYSISVGFKNDNLMADLSFTNQDTQGGGDIRRQDMPFVSNRMNFSRIGAMVMYQVPKTNGLAVRAGAGYTVAGRNVGQSSSFSGGLMYTLNFAGKE